jgi:MFS family permease
MAIGLVALVGVRDAIGLSVIPGLLAAFAAAATQLALVLYVLYNVAATTISVPAGRHGDRYSPTRVLAAGAVCFAAVYAGFAAGPRQPWLLAAGFILAGLGIGCGETAESAAVAALAPASLRSSAFGLLATAQAGANLAASVVAGILWTAVSPAAAFLFLTAAMITAVPLIAASTRNHRSRPGIDGSGPAQRSG